MNTANPLKPSAFSFTFRGRNSRDMGLIATSYDFIMPEKRERKQAVPFRHGANDYGAKWYNDRILRLRCTWITARLRKMTRSDIREIAYWLSQKGRIILDIEADKYYIGEVYNSNELIAHYNYAVEENGGTDTTDGEFELEFTCEPFAYRATVTHDLTDGVNKIEYTGTAETPCVIILRNNNNFALNNVQVAVVRKRV
jgi:phage-related protein